MRFRIASILNHYTDGQNIIELEADTLMEALDQLDDKFPGIKFRFIDEQNQIRPHMNLFLNKEHLQSLDCQLSEDDEIFVVQSLSGGMNQ